ncbi:MATE family efflux transporter [Desulfovibrio mangrovi]|uniref:MATE family efflux transporter n=1 Tax=Desulfovibrio mangrovi TaxID=2976983 RepID=UPI002246760D|nr:MATE family efflux transporter [Desulfovibrio mangrovi]UZP68552.1 MATE family efflux transporter [Desulfovibrio mangrovi]
MTATAEHYRAAPNTTLLRMSIPVLISLIAEPLTGLADTAFVARLGADALASLGIGTMVLTSTFWIFNFLGVGTQTELARHLGSGKAGNASALCTASIALAVTLGILSMLIAWPFLETAAQAMGGKGDMLVLAVEYMQARLFGAPAVLITFSCFGALRGVQDMKAPLLIAAMVNALNILLDWLLIFGIGPFPALGVQGAALATSASQWGGAIWSLALVHKHIGFSRTIHTDDVRRLISIGGDMFARTGMVLVFLLLATRVATEAGADSGAAHQAIRQFFFFTALFLDAFAISGQSLIGFFMGSDDRPTARNVAKTVCIWSLGTGCLLLVAMLVLKQQIAWLLIPQESYAIFSAAWLIAALIQPVNALSFATDGIHWGTGDFRFLRNAMFASATAGAAILGATTLLEPATPLVWVWIATGVWTTARTAFGVFRVWPGSKKSPLHINAIQ